MLKSKGHHVEIVEGHLDRLSYPEIEKIVSAAKPDLLGVHMVYHWKNDMALFSFLEKVKYEGISPYITAYGFYPTFAFEDILTACPAIDAVITGEPEATFVDLAEALAQNASPGNIPGLTWRDESGKIVALRRKPVEDLDSLPFPVRTGAMFRLPEVNIQGSRGCYGGCTFCYINPFYGQRAVWRGRSPENIAAEIDEIICQRGVTDFYFTDPNFFGPGQRGQERARHLASLLKPRHIRFGIEARVNDIHDETIETLVDAGLRHILIGLESGRDHSLKRINKMTTVAENERAIRILRKHGIGPNIGFIMFEPDSSLEDVRINFEFLRRNNLLQHLPVTANVLYHHQIILKGTPAYQRLHEEGRLEILSSSTYEGVTAFTDHKVAVLAEIMRKITNFIFVRMAGIWSGKEQEPVDGPKKNSQINGLLVQWFETVLNGLEAGELFSDDRKVRFIYEAEKAVNQILQE
jgi:radical SAM superfamily enzyme YgiQ (UPF0313 family)